MSSETQRNNIEQFDQKVKFPTFDYQGLPVLYLLMVVFSTWVMITERFIYTPPFFFFLFFTSIGLLFEWWCRVRFIARNDGEDWIVIGHQFTEKFVFSQDRYRISELTFTKYSKNKGENGEKTNYVQLILDGKAVFDCPGEKRQIREIIPELFTQQEMPKSNIAVPSERTVEETDNFWSNIKAE